MEIFQQTEVPANLARSPINEHAKWYTWSRAFRALFKPWMREVERLPRLISVRVLGGQRYDKTISLSGVRIRDRGLARELQGYVDALYSHPRPRRIRLYTELIDDDLDGKGLRYLFAFLRDELVRLAGDPMAALYAPLGATGSQVQDFPLHADLYVPQLLFNVFEVVPRDGSGQSIFLRFSTLRELIAGLEVAPHSLLPDIATCLGEARTVDRFEKFYDLIHNPENSWSRSLKRAMYKRRLRIKLDRGQGYMIDDRAWLHGREAPQGGVSRRRVHRLVFNTRAVELSVRKPG